VGKGKGKGVTLSSTQVEGAAPPICRKHEANSDAPCHACRKRRQWDEQQNAAQAADELDAKRKAREASINCPDCHGTNVIEVGDNAVRKCDHRAVAHA
jgi:hypothetical protein